MKVKLMILFLLVLTMTFLSSCKEKESEKVISKEELPALVLQNFEASYAGGEIKECAEEMEDGQKFYEISFIYEDRKIDAVYTETGAVHAIEEMITQEELPQEVLDALSIEYPAFTIEKIEKIDQSGKQSYEIKGTDEGTKQRWEIKYSEQGKVIDREKIKSATE